MTACGQDRPFRKTIYVMKSEAFARKVLQAAKNAGVGLRIEFIKLLYRNGQRVTGKRRKL